ncbi:hypothetical protein [Saccharopolyspora phatthalungensis]|uniref:Uncharacterized protein n=1 Tax=Saccharopolyspora phatthalungensis TaxID=664693 RepID=A0A840QDB6_9PSEU|nr:hypothetical protein [Saccharopolyspora phatthalungensis]MBB5158396.1 hypothetical protein [Saccharopolyspora phatthalungensis]
MVTQRQLHQRRADHDLIALAAEAVRRHARRQQAESAIGRAPIVPGDRYVLVGFLDELALAAGRGELPADVRRVGLELCEKLIAEARNQI